MLDTSWITEAYAIGMQGTINKEHSLTIIAKVEEVTKARGLVEGSKEWRSYRVQAFSAAMKAANEAALACFECRRHVPAPQAMMAQFCRDCQRCALHCRCDIKEAYESMEGR